MGDQEVEEFLAHHGVKGMHWGVHRARSQGKSDAEEFAKAKLAIGEGAGNRRKLIKAKVNQRSRNQHYKQAFDEHLAKQDLAKLAGRAKTNARTKKAVKGTTKTVRGVHRSLTGGFGPVSVTAAGVAGAYLYAKKTGLDKALINQAKTQWGNRGKYAETAKWLKDQGVY